MTNSTQPATPFTALGYGEVADAFQRNFSSRSRSELGAAFAAIKNGEVIVDLWGGIADSTTNTPWAADTMQLVFSGSKGLVAVCVLMLSDAGSLDIDAPVSRYWPEFAAAGKERIRVCDVLSHRARIPGLSTPLTWEQATDAQAVAQLLAAQPPIAEPRAESTYHALTYGWILGELVRRVEGRTIGQFFADEVATPLELELWIGLPPGYESRLARVELAPDWEATSVVDDPLARSVANPLRFDHQHFPWNEPRWLGAEVPAANAVGSARSIAKLYANLDQLLKPSTIERARKPITTGHDTLSDKPIAFGLGFQLQSATKPFGPPEDAFGHGGAGGSRHGYWPTRRIAFSYSMNRMREEARDTRATSVLEALLRADNRALG